MSRTRIKICGITRPEDAAIAAELGVDAIGMNFFSGPRRIEKEKAAEILRSLVPLITPVALSAFDLPTYQDAPSIHQIRNESPSLAISNFQIYGELPDELVDGQSSIKIWMVFPIDSPEAIRHAAAKMFVWKHSPAAVLFDTASPQKLGGTGQSFNWHWIAEARAAGELNGLPPIILAGGLTPGNVADAIRIARPYAVDVSSGVEVPGKPGVKDPIKMRDFIQAAQSA
jgi:phosphoribosylanthranilate isomerase